jgi:hypothetical protein
MELMVWTVVCICLALMAVVWKLFIMTLNKKTLERQIEELLTLSDSLNRTEGRRARQIAWRDKTIGDLVRELPPVAG